MSYCIQLDFVVAEFNRSVNSRIVEGPEGVVNVVHDVSGLENKVIFSNVSGDLESSNFVLAS